MSQREAAKHQDSAPVFPPGTTDENLVRFYQSDPQGKAGRRVRLLTEERFEAGQFEVIWNGRDDAGRALPSNVYYAKLEADSVVVMRKMTLPK